MSEGEQQIQFFNAYYIRFLKSINDISKSKKESENKAVAVEICKAVKKEYKVMDQSSPEYLNKLNKTGIWEKYNALEDREIFTDEFKECEVYNGISIKSICDVVDEPYFAHHLIAILDIFHENVPDNVAEIVKILNKPEEFSNKVEEITDEKVKAKLEFLMLLHTKHKKASFSDNLKDIESTTLGKLAKEIMGDLNIEEIQKSMNEQNGNIFETFKNPNSGLGKVLSSVSQKMLSKIGSGELNQESLLTDAIDLAGKLQNLMPEGMGSQLGNIGEMLAQLQKMSKATGSENPMDMMQEMMKGMNLNKKQQNRASSRMNSTINKSKLSSRLKKKLEKRKQNNIQTEVKEDE